MYIYNESMITQNDTPVYLILFFFFFLIDKPNSHQTKIDIFASNVPINTFMTKERFRAYKMAYIL